MSLSHQAVPFVAFRGDRLIATGGLAELAAAVRESEARVRGPSASEGILVFNAVTGEQVDLDPRAEFLPWPSEAARGPSVGEEPDEGASPAVAADEAAAGSVHRGRGRPRLGVVPREVTLLPRHWDWLAGQPGGASAAIRRLVEQARLASAERDRRRLAQECAYRFMSAMLGNQPDFEEVTRALFAGDRPRFRALSIGWPQDPRDVAWRLADGAFPPD
jgi:uncharacterized protein